MPRRAAYFIECDGTLLHLGKLCGGSVWKYRREAKSFGVPFMAYARLCRTCHAAARWWRDAERVEAA